MISGNIRCKATNIIAESDILLSVWDAEKALDNSYGLRGAREVILDALAEDLVRINTTTLELSVSE